MIIKPLEGRLSKLWACMTLAGVLIIAPQGIYAEEAPAEQTLEDALQPKAETPTTEAELPLRPDSGPGPVSWIAMVLLGGAAFFALVLFKRKQSTMETERPLLSLINSVRIGGKWQISLIQVPGKLLVVGVTDKGLTTLTEIVDPVAETTTPSESESESTIETLSQPLSEANEAFIDDDPVENRALMDRILRLADKQNQFDGEDAAGLDLTNDASRKEILRRLEAYKGLQVNG